MAGISFGLAWEQPSASANKPHYVSFATARAAANDTLFEVWNGQTNAARRFAVDLNGKLYSSSLTAGDLPYGVSGGVSGLKRLDYLSIGAANEVLVSTGTAPAWSTSLNLSGAITAGGLITASLGLTVASGQTLTLTGATVTGLTAASVTAGTFPAGAFSIPTLAVTSGLTLTGATITGQPTWSSTQAMSISGGAPAGSLTGATLAAGVTASSLTSVGTLTSLTMGGTLTLGANTLALASATVTGQPTWSSTQAMSISGNAATATALQTGRTINGTTFDGTANITVTAAAGTLTGNTLAAGVTASSLTSVGTLSSLTVSGTLTPSGGVAPNFSSAETALPAANGDASVAHGLGAVPRDFWIHLRCKTAEFGYSVGDEILFDGYTQSGAMTIWADATNVGFSRGSGSGSDIHIARRDSTGSIALTDGNWRIVFYAIK